MGTMAEDKSVAQMQAAGARLLQKTPGLADRLAAEARAPSAPGGRVSGAGGRLGEDRDVQIADLQRQLEEEKSKNRSIQGQYKYRVASFVKREAQTKSKIEALERQTFPASGDPGEDDDDHNLRMDVIGNMHKQVIVALEWVQDNTAKMLQEQEKDLMRTFKSKLQDVAKEVEAQRGRKGDQGNELQTRFKRSLSELHEAQGLAHDFDKKNQMLLVENQKLQETIRNREDDRQALMKEVVQSRKEAARLKAQCKDPVPVGLGASGGSGGNPSGIASGGASPAAASNAGASDPGATQASASRPRKPYTQRQIEQARLQETRNKPYEQRLNVRDAMQRLQRMADAERRVARALKADHAHMLQQRTELETLLSQSLDDVRAEVQRRRLSAEGEAGGASAALDGDEPPAALPATHELTKQDRERVLELLLSQPRVVQLLYSRTLQPVQEGDASTGGFAGESKDLPSSGSAQTPTKNDDDFSWLSDVVPPGT